MTFVAPTGRALVRLLDAGTLELFLVPDIGFWQIHTSERRTFHQLF